MDNIKAEDAACFQSPAGRKSESGTWPAEKLWDLRFCVRHRLPLHKAARFLRRTETEVRDKAAKLGLRLLEEKPSAHRGHDASRDNGQVNPSMPSPRSTPRI